MGKALFLVGVFLITGCSAVQVIAPNPRVEPPELRGDPGLKVEVNTVGAHAFRSTNDGRAHPPDVFHPTTQGTLDESPAVLYSPASPVELGLEVSPLSTGAALIAKWQPLGEGTRVATTGNVSLGLYLRVGANHEQVSGDQKSLFGSGGYGWKGTLNGSYVHYGLSLGYRLDERSLIYLGGAFGQYWMRSEVNQDGSASDPGGVYKSGFTGYGNTGGLGMLFNWTHVQFYLGAEFTHIEYDRTSPMDDIYFHGGVYITPR